MRLDQFERAQALAEQLMDVLIGEINPESWTGAGVDLATLKYDEAKRIRGDRYWDKKNAAMTLTLLTKMHVLIGITQRRHDIPLPDDAPSEEDVEAEMATAEKEAVKAIEAAQNRSRNGRSK